MTPHTTRTDMPGRISACTCYVRRLRPEERMTLRFGAHDASCPSFRRSLDPVDEENDRAVRIRFLRRLRAEDEAARGRDPICHHLECVDAAASLCLVGCHSPCPVHGTPCTSHGRALGSTTCFAYCPRGAHSWDPQAWAALDAAAREEARRKLLAREGAGRARA